MSETRLQRERWECSCGETNHGTDSDCIGCGFERPALSLTATLALRGLSHRRTNNADNTGQHHILQAGRVVFTGRAGEVWEWLAASGRKG